MTEIETKTAPVVDTDNGSKDPRKRHIVELDEETNEYKDRALCGYLTASVHVEHNGSICQKCVELSKLL
jgi:hypothetical protein